jgi:hypothetical protein
MTILQCDTEFGVPSHMPQTTHRTRTGIVIGRSYVPHPKWDSRPDAERLQRALLRKPRAQRIDGGWRSVVTAVVLGVALAATLFFTLSN